MLVGRQAEHARIAELLAGAREGRSRALLLRGDPGIGKSALLEQARSAATGMTVVRALGVEAEAELEFSGLHELCLPLLGLLGEIPARQAQALRGALGLADSEAADRFTIGAATLTLLAAAAEQAPLLAVVDDAHWLDRPSQDALLFAARRLQGDRTAMLFAAREGELRPFRAEGIETIVLSGLTSEESSNLIELEEGGAIAPAVAAQLHQATGGNPLAMRELLPRLSAGQRAGAEPLARPLPAGPAVERAYAGRAEGLPEATRVGLLVASAAITDRLEPIMRAIEAIGEEVRLEPAEDAGLIEVTGARIAFHHPLVRSAIYGEAAPSAVRAAHRALAAAFADPVDAELRAWHLGAAAVGPDEAAAAALAAVAEVARRRSGYAPAAAALERAARLTPAGELQLRRLLEAADAAWLGGAPERASALADEVLAGCEEGALRGAALRLRGSIEYFAGRPAAASTTLLDASQALGEVDAAAAVSAAADAVNASVPAAETALMLVAAERARALAPQDGGAADFEASLALGYALIFNCRVAEGEPLVRRGGELFAARTAAAPLQVGRLAWALGGIGLHGRAYEQVRETITVVRGAGAVASLPYLLGASVWHGVHLGRWSGARTEATEALELATEIGQPLARCQALSLLAWLHGLRGEEEACRGRAEEALAANRALGLDLYQLLARLGPAMLDAGAGRWEAAIGELEGLSRESEERGLYVGGLAPSLELAGALAHGGRDAEAAAILDGFEGSGIAAVPLQAALAGRCRALLADRDGFDALFAQALEHHPDDCYPFEAARTRLAFGERLRRAGRRVDARDQLRPALAEFERLGSAAWAAQAREELAASGETRRRRDVESRDDLSPRELQVAHQVAQGKTNKEVAVALFLSPKTVEYHLKHIYGKLGIRSRGELIRLSTLDAMP